MLRQSLRDGACHATDTFDAIERFRRQAGTASGRRRRNICSSSNPPGDSS
jgi:hypothetical protein